MASSATASPTGNAKRGIKWNNVFAAAHRRSTSMTGLSKANVADALRSTTSLDTFSPREGDASALLLLVDQAQAIAEEEENGIGASPSVSPKSSIALPPRRPRPAPRLWTDPQMAENTLPGLETVIAPNSVQLQTVQPPASQGSGPMTPSTGAEARGFSRRVSSRSHERSLSNRRNGSVAELDLGSSSKKMKPVLESFLDSPVFPGRTPKSGRKTPRTPAASRDCPTPRAVASDPQLSEGRQDMEPALKTPTWEERSQRRASSMLLPSGLAPLVVPSAPERTPPVPPLDPPKTDLQSPIDSAASSGQSKKTLAGGKEQPPKVPPKSPRTLLRAFPIPRPTLTSSGTPSTSHTANSSISSISPIETPITALTNMAWSPMEQIPSPILPEDEEEISTVQPDQSLLRTGTETPHSLATSSPKPERSREILTSQQPKPFQGTDNLKHSRSNSSLANTISDERYLNSIHHPLGQHQRMISESSVLNRGRPMKRGDVPLQRSISRGLRMAFINNSFTELPKGYKRGQLPDAVISNEMHGLRRDAEEQASGYEILTQVQIANLHQELRLLDENCEHIRQTISGFREGRRSVLKSMRFYLNAPGDVVSMREQTLKQEAKLSDLDESVDDWMMKLEAAMNRKQLVQIKLSQHVAAILSWSNPLGDGGRISEGQTPPRSPERKPAEEAAVGQMVEGHHAKEGEGRDVESIRIYADSGVASLLRSIEQEIDMMDQSRRNGY